MKEKAINCPSTATQYSAFHYINMGNIELSIDKRLFKMVKEKSLVF